MSEPFVTHQLVGLKCSSQILFVYSDRHSHEHVLGSLNNNPINLQQIRSFEGLEAKIVISEVPFVVNDFLNLFVVLKYDLINVLREQWCVLPSLVFAEIELLCYLFQRAGGFFMEIVHSNSCRQ